MLPNILCTLLIGSLLLSPPTFLVGVPTNQNTDKDRLLANARRYLPNQAQQEALIYELQQRAADYDSVVHLVKKYIPPTANHYHTHLIDTTAHPFRESTYYAADLMDSGLPEYQQRAFDIFRTVIAHQDQDSSHDTYGIWSYHREEPCPR